MAELPRAGIRRLMESSGAERISQDAIRSLRDVTEKTAVKLAKAATEIAQEGNRKTLRKEDIHQAAKRIREEGIL